MDQVGKVHRAAARQRHCRLPVAVLANHLSVWLDLELQFVLARPNDIAAGIKAEHRARQIRVALTN